MGSRTGSHPALGTPGARKEDGQHPQPYQRRPFALSPAPAQGPEEASEN